MLVIDDDRAVRDLIQSALQEEGYRVLHAAGTRGLELARTHQPEVILLDILLPGPCNGVELSQSLRAGRSTAHIPIISMSGHMRAATPFAMEAEEHLAKPLELDTLCATVAHWAGAPGS